MEWVINSLICKFNCLFQILIYVLVIEIKDRNAMTQRSLVCSRLRAFIKVCFLMPMEKMNGLKTFGTKNKNPSVLFSPPSLSFCLRASLWSSCVVLPLLALTWMSAVLAMTDKRSILFQILFAVFDSLQGFVIVMVHCILRKEVGLEQL